MHDVRGSRARPLQSRAAGCVSSRQRRHCFSVQIVNQSDGSHPSDVSRETMVNLRTLAHRPPVTYGSRAADVRLQDAVDELRQRRRAVLLGNMQDTPTKPKTAVFFESHPTPHRSISPIAWREAVWSARDDGHDVHTVLARHGRRAALHALVSKRPPGETAKERAWALRDRARVAHPSSRCADCGEVLHGMPAIMRRPDGGHALGGVVTCANVWACPVCALKIKASRAEQIKEGVALHRQHFGAGSMLMLTLTASHSAGDDLRAYREAFQSAAGRLMTSQWSEKRGAAGYVYGAEVTHGRNGWHYHRHYIVAFDRPISDFEMLLIHDELSIRWRALVVKFMGEHHAPNEHGLDLRQLNVVDYISKLGLELSDVGAFKRAKNGNVSPWGLLSDTASGHGGAFDNFAHYVRAMKGAKCVQFSNRLLALWKKLGIAHVSEESLADDTIGAALVTEIPISVWRWLRSSGRVYRMLADCDAGNLPDFQTQKPQWGDGWQVEREAIRDEAPFPTIVREPESERRVRVVSELRNWNAACDALLSPSPKRKRVSVYEDGSPIARYNRLRKKMSVQLNPQLDLLENMNVKI